MKVTFRRMAAIEARARSIIDPHPGVVVLDLEADGTMTASGTGRIVTPEDAEEYSRSGVALILDDL